MKKFFLGFSLIELMVVITIIGILVGVGFIYLGNYSDKQNDDQRKDDITALATAIEQFKADQGHYPIINSSSGIHAWEIAKILTDKDGNLIYPNLTSNCNGTSASGTVIKIVDGVACDDLSLQLSGAVYLPRIPSSTTTNLWTTDTGSNVVLNPSFEIGSGNDFTDWSKTITGSTTITATTDAIHGSRALTINVVDGAGYGITAKSPIPIVGGQKYIFSYFGKSSISGTGYYYYIKDNENWCWHGEINGWTTNCSSGWPSRGITTSWEKYQREVIMRDEATSLTAFSLRRTTGSGNYTDYLDDVGLTLSPPKEYLKSISGDPKYGISSFNYSYGSSCSGMNPGDSYWLNAVMATGSESFYEVGPANYLRSPQTCEIP